MIYTDGLHIRGAKGVERRHNKRLVNARLACLSLRMVTSNSIESKELDIQ